MSPFDVLRGVATVLTPATADGFSVWVRGASHAPAGFVAPSLARPGAWVAVPRGAFPGCRGIRATRAEAALAIATYALGDRTAVQWTADEHERRVAERRGLPVAPDEPVQVAPPEQRPPRHWKRGAYSRAAFAAVGLAVVLALAAVTGGCADEELIYSENDLRVLCDRTCRNNGGTLGTYETNEGTLLDPVCTCVCEQEACDSYCRLFFGGAGQCASGEYAGDFEVTPPCFCCH